MKTIKDITAKEKTVLIRADYNVPISEGKVTDDYRIRQSISTLQYLLEQGCHLVIISHLGRPGGQPDPKYSLQPIAELLEELLGQTVTFVRDFEEVDSDANQVTLCENLRFDPGEEENDQAFAQRLAKLGEIFVQDGFGVVHRAHASTTAITEHLPSVAGLLLEKETEAITQAMENPKRPLVAIFGGAKISDKIQVVEQFIDRADHILIGGAMANTFFDYEGLEIGYSNYESGQEDTITRLAQKAQQRQKYVPDCDCVENGRVCMKCVDMLGLPEDVAVAKAIDKSERRMVVDKSDVQDDEYILDIGTSTVYRFQDIVARAGTVVWNGPLGLTELPNFAHGSNYIAKTLKDHKHELTSIIGGGDTVGFAVQWDPDKGESFTHVSTGGGAALDFMAGKEMPGIAALA